MVNFNSLRCGNNHLEFLIVISNLLAAVNSQSSLYTGDDYTVDDNTTQLHDGRISNDAMHRGHYQTLHRPWMEQYAALHKFIMSPESSPKMQRYVVWTCGTCGSCAGWGNRLLGIASSLLLAVLTDRAFLIDWGDSPPLDAFARSHYIDWRVPATFARARTPHSHGSRFLAAHTIDLPAPPRGDGHELRRFFRAVAPHELAEDVLWIQSSVGWFVDLLRNPNFLLPLCGLGLDHPDHALAQLAHLLLRPHGPAAAAVRHLAAQANGRPVVALQVAVSLLPLPCQCCGVTPSACAVVALW
jgi:hypothetical protein